METVLLLQILVSLIFFANKVLVLVGKRSGWLTGVVAAALAAVYFFLINLHVYVVLEVGLIVTMGYGFLKKGKPNPRVTVCLRWFLVVIMAAQTLFVFQGAITLVEFVSSVLMLLGTYYLTHDAVRLGWACYVAAHLFAAYLGFCKDQVFFADFQIASAIVALVGMRRD